MREALGRSEGDKLPNRTMDSELREGMTVMQTTLEMKEAGVHSRCDVWSCGSDGDESHTTLCEVSSQGRTEYYSDRGGKKMTVSEGIADCLRLSGCGEDYSIVMYEDIEGAKALAGNPLSSRRSKRIDVRYDFIRELVGAGRSGSCT